MSAVQHIQGVYHRLGPIGAVAVGAGALAVVVLGMTGVSFVRSMLTTAPAVDSSNNGNKNVDAYKGQFKDYLAQIDGRTIFVLPGAPKAKEPEVVAPTGPPPPPPKPTSYEGSAVSAMVLDTVWFENGNRLRVGDPEKDDTQVVAVHAPWEAVLKWKGEEFTVPLFPRDKVVFKPEEKPPETSPVPKPPAETAQAADAAKPATDTNAVKPPAGVGVKPADAPALPAPATPPSKPADTSPKIDS